MSLEQLVFDVFAKNCTSRPVMDTVAGRWGILSMAALLEGTHRFNELRRRVDGVSEKMLSQTLHALERDGLVTREVVSAIPPRVEYSLTDGGRRIAVKLVALIELIEAEMPEITKAQARYDAREDPAAVPQGRRP
ncbi:winged helix-turn-helix transcriptional regulator [Dactylosporangium sp. NPDC048998]|uniref:winged helix-turn-helix transcriptional regulator n=1 Tax=Dactylosporangium sp. NPDC048998 TaxID=3363976 RepID=UPI00370FFED9